MMMPELPSGEDNARAPFFYVVLATARCAACGVNASVLALALPENHEVLDEFTAEWSMVHAVALLSFVAHLPDALSARLRALCAGYEPHCLAACEEGYSTNRCLQCDALFDDDALHSEPDLAFLPSSEANAAGIELHHIAAPFSACARGLSLDPPFFTAFRRA